MSAITRVQKIHWLRVRAQRPLIGCIYPSMPESHLAPDWLRVRALRPLICCVGLLYSRYKVTDVRGVLKVHDKELPGTLTALVSLAMNSSSRIIPGVGSSWRRLVSTAFTNDAAAAIATHAIPCGIL